MKSWIKISLALCSFGFFREMRPSEPFVTEFLSGEWRNVTADQVNREVYPLGTYSYLAQLVIIFLITDMLRYKPIIVVSSVVGIVLWCLLLWTYSLVGLQLVQLCYGCFMAAEVAYYTYMYAKVDKDKYQQVTGHARAGNLCGRFLASVIAQILISFKWMDFRELNYISLAAQIVSFGIAIFLPSVGTSMYFYATESTPSILPTNTSDYQSNMQIKSNLSTVNLTHESQKSDNVGNSNDSCDSMDAPTFSCNRALKLLLEHFVAAYTNRIVLQWSIWWSLAMCGFLLVQSYVQLLWIHIDPGSNSMFNGGVEAALTLLGALSAFAAGFFESEKYQKWDLLVLTVCSVIEGVLILISTFTTSLWTSYIMYILFGALYQFMITLASASVAKNLIEDSFALIFGINTLLALILQSIITLVAISETGGLELDVKSQFIVFGCYFIILAVIYGIFGILSLVYNSTKNANESRSIVERAGIRDDGGL